MNRSHWLYIILFLEGIAFGADPATKAVVPAVCHGIAFYPPTANARRRYSWKISHNRQDGIPPLVSFGRQYFLLRPSSERIDSSTTLSPLLLLNQDNGTQRPSLPCRASAVMKWSAGSYWLLVLDELGDLWVYHQKYQDSRDTKTWVGTRVPLPKPTARDPLVTLQLFRERKTPKHIVVFLGSRSGKVLRGDLMLQSRGFHLAVPFTPFATLNGPFFEATSDHELLSVDDAGQIRWVDEKSQQWLGSVPVVPHAIYVSRNLGRKRPGLPAERSKRATLWVAGRRESERWGIFRWEGYNYATYEETPRGWGGNNRARAYVPAGFYVTPLGQLALWWQRREPSERLLPSGIWQTSLDPDSEFLPLSSFVANLPMGMVDEVVSVPTKSPLAAMVAASSPMLYDHALKSSPERASRSWVLRLYGRARLRDLIERPDFFEVRSAFARIGLPVDALILCLSAVISEQEVSLDEFIGDLAATPHRYDSTLLALAEILDESMAGAMGWLTPNREVETLPPEGFYRLLDTFDRWYRRPSDRPSLDKWPALLEQNWQKLGHHNESRLYDVLARIANRRDPLAAIQGVFHVMEVIP